MEFNEDSVPEVRIRTDETDKQIAEEVEKCAEEGRIVCYFNSESMLYRWRLSRALRA